jgi:hypothetical protein
MIVMALRLALSRFVSPDCRVQGQRRQLPGGRDRQDARWHSLGSAAPVRLVVAHFRDQAGSRQGLPLRFPQIHARVGRALHDDL